MGFCVILVMLQRQVCSWVAVKFCVDPAAPEKSGQLLWYLGLCNLTFLGLVCRESLSPLHVKDSGVACPAPKVDVVSFCTKQFCSKLGSLRCWWVDTRREQTWNRVLQLE